MDHEAIYTALFNLVKDSTTFKTQSRKWKHWDDVPAANCPALFLVQLGDDVDLGQRVPGRFDMDAEVVIYADTAGASDLIPMSVLNPLIDKVVTKLSTPDQNNAQTLGGLVEFCRIAGRIETDGGALGDRAVAVIPIKMLTTY